MLQARVMRNHVVIFLKVTLLYKCNLPKHLKFEMDLYEAHYMLIFGETEQELLLTLDYCTEFKSYLSK